MKPEFVSKMLLFAQHDEVATLRSLTPSARPNDLSCHPMGLFGREENNHSGCICWQSQPTHRGGTGQRLPQLSTHPPGIRWARIDRVNGNPTIGDGRAQAQTERFDATLRGSVGEFVWQWPQPLPRSQVDNTSAGAFLEETNKFRTKQHQGTKVDGVVSIQHFCVQAVYGALRCVCRIVDQNVDLPELCARPSEQQLWTARLTQIHFDAVRSDTNFADRVHDFFRFGVLDSPGHRSIIRPPVSDADIDASTRKSECHSGAYALSPGGAGYQRDS
jgi:hypothetical protein